MQSPRATVIRKEITSLGVGLLEQSLEEEGAKGCSPFICTEPVALEPPYQTFDANWILSHASGTVSKGEATSSAPDLAPMATFDIYAAPEDILSLSWMESMLRGLAVLPGRYSFELFGGGGQVWVRFAVPLSQLAGFRAAVEGLFPGLRIRENPEPFPVESLAAVNELVPVAPYHRTLTLIGREGASPLGIAALAISDLPSPARGVFQVVMASAAENHDWHYNIQNLVEAEIRAMKLAQLGGISTEFKYDDRLPPFLELTVREKVAVDVAFHATVARYAVWGAKQDVAHSFLQALRVATGMVRFGNRAWRVVGHDELLSSLGPEKLATMVAQRLSHRPGVMLTSRELATLVHFPNDRNLKMISAIQQRAGIPWLPFEAVQDDAAVVGTNTYAGREIAVAIPMDVRTRHTYVPGVTGWGKSELLTTMATADVEHGQGICVIDPHGDLALGILARMPKQRLQDLVYISFSERGLVPRWNPFRSDAPAGKLADDIARCFLAQTLAGGARMEHNFRMLAYSVVQLGGTLDDLAEMVGRTPRGEVLRQEAASSITNRQVLRFLRTELPSYRDADLASVRNKLSRLLTDENLGAMFSQVENELHPRSWMDEGKVVLVNLAAGELGADHVRFAGGLLISLIYRAALTRGDVPREKRRSFVLYLDEFQLLQAGMIAETLSEGRKFGLAAVLAHQERGQLGNDLAQAVGNCATKVVFRPSPDDVGYFIKALNNRVTAELLLSLDVGEAVVSCGSRVATIKTHLCSTAPLRDPRLAARQYAEHHYVSVGKPSRDSGEVTALRVMRERVYDTFKPQKGEE